MKRTLLVCLSVYDYNDDFFRVHGFWQEPNDSKYHASFKVSRKYGEKKIWSANHDKAPMLETHHT
jgi:hypothetical protein